MLFAFLSAETTRVGASPELGADEFTIGGGEATDDPGGCKADIGAVEIGANTRHLLGHLVFPKASVCAGVACLRTRIACGDTLHGPGMIARGARRDVLRTFA
jgi:hypothetical protein